MTESDEKQIVAKLAKAMADDLRAKYPARESACRPGAGELLIWRTIEPSSQDGWKGNSYTLNSRLAPVGPRLIVNIPNRGSKDPLHLLIDSTGIKAEGEEGVEGGLRPNNVLCYKAPTTSKLARSRDRAMHNLAELNLKTLILSVICYDPRSVYFVSSRIGFVVGTPPSNQLSNLRESSNHPSLG